MNKKKRGNYKTKNVILLSKIIEINKDIDKKIDNNNENNIVKGK